MKEISDILKAIDEMDDGSAAALATVVDLQGSGYRLPGARMLITSDGNAVGTVSGGCLEADVLARAKRVIESGRAEIFTYDTTAEENSVFSLNMGCRGLLRVLLEPVNARSEMISALRKTWSDRRPLETATLIDSDSDGDLRVGNRIIIDVEPLEIIGSHALLDAVPQLHDDLLTFAGTSTRSETIRYEVGEYFLEFCFESLRPPVRLLIFGAGADAVPLAQIAHEIGWQVSVYDHRPAFLANERFPGADELVLLARDAEPDIATDDLTAIVSMNHNYDRDKATLTAAINSGTFYIGALGPKRRTAQILDEIGTAAEKISSLRSPAGLDIGGDSPETIAISIIAEIQSALADRPGRPLRDREAPIYDH